MHEVQAVLREIEAVGRIGLLPTLKHAPASEAILEVSRLAIPLIQRTVVPSIGWTARWGGVA